MSRYNEAHVTAYAAYTAGFMHYLHNHRDQWPVIVEAPALPKGRQMAKVNRLVEVEGEFVVMVDGDSLPIANGLTNPYEANVVAMLVSTGPYKGEHLAVGFKPDDGGDITIDEESFWYNGREYQAGDEMSEPIDALMWYARYGVSEESKAKGGSINFNRIDEDALCEWLIRVASEHEVTGLLPEAITDKPESSTDSGDRYHLTLLIDLVRGDDHKLDPSERKGLIETLERLRERAGLDD